jgi:hypothetical protein
MLEFILRANLSGLALEVFGEVNRIGVERTTAAY